ncbi:putative WRKY transcription factor 43 [Forsythia ovata]|uniref:WRKY transcription factor 43 n=1 Tax=Forsythia ovata TaxID=205694 RepID=A0ABD1UF40_9LAMI
MENHPKLFLASSSTVPFSSNMNGVFYNRIVPEPDGIIKVKDHSFSKSLVSMKNEVKSGKKKGDDQMKTTKPRIAFQTRTKVDILDDGYRWRKYGQKSVKNQKFPRSYYRCTHLSCNVKKQVQRQSEDEGIVVTTYEGRHMHPVEKHSANFEQILNQMHIYPPF